VWRPGLSQVLGVIIRGLAKSIKSPTSTLLLRDGFLSLRLTQLTFCWFTNRRADLIMLCVLPLRVKAFSLSHHQAVLDKYAHIRKNGMVVFMRGIAVTASVRQPNHTRGLGHIRARRPCVPTSSVAIRTGQILRRNDHSLCGRAVLSLERPWVLGTVAQHGTARSVSREEAWSCSVQECTGLCCILLDINRLCCRV
jgi:hypothetical protein